MRIPLAADIQTRDGSLSKDSKLVNCMVEIDGDSAFVTKRPGMLKTLACGAGQALGMVSWEGQIYNAIGNNFYQTTHLSIPDGASAPPDPSTITVVGQFGYATGANNGAAYINGSTMIFACEAPSDGYVQWIGSSDGGVTWSQLSVDYDTNSLYGAVFAYIGGVLCRFHSNGGALPTSRLDTSSNNGASWTLVTSSVQGDMGLSYAPDTTFSEGGLAYFFIANPNGTGAYDNDTLNLCSTNGSSVSIVATIPGVSATTMYSLKMKGFLKLNGVYYFYLASVGYPYYVRIYKSVNLTSWTYSDISGVDYGHQYSLITDGTSIALFNGSIIKTIDVTVMAVVSTETLTPPPYAFGASRNAVTISGKAVVNYVDSSNGIVYSCRIHIGTGTGQSYAGPGYTYSYTTVTPGLPLSWVGTSPGTYTKLMFIKNTEKAWTLTFGSPGTLTQVTDPDYPATTVPGAVYLDGYFFVMDKDGTIFGCDLENPASWNALNYVSAEAEWDKGVAIAKHQNYVVALKDWTTEVFYDAANPVGSPLSRVANATVQIGCAQGYSPVQFHGGLVFMSKTREKGRSVHFFAPNSLDPQEIATPAIQRVLNAADLTVVRSWGGKLGGKVLYVLNLVSANLTLVYDFVSKKWSQWTSDAAGAEGYFKYGFYATDGDRDYILHESSGDVFNFTPAVYQDDGADIKVHIRTGRIDGGNLDRKTQRALTVVGDELPTSVSVQISDDDYGTFSAARSVAMNSKPPRLSRLGMFRRRSFDLRHVDNTPLRLLAIDADVTQAR